MTLTVIWRIQLVDRPWNFLFDRPTAQTRRQICACDSSNFSAFHPLLAFDIATLKMFDLDSNKFSRSKVEKVHFCPKHPQNRKMWTILSSRVKRNTGRQNLIERNFHFQGQIFKFSIFKSVTNFVVWYLILFVLACTKSQSYFDLENLWPWQYFQRYTCWVVSFKV
jgi:hypothetical protein